METRNILSLFDGMSCAQQALERSGIKYDNYYASEIDNPAMKVTMANYPNTIQLGSVVDIDTSKLPPILILFGGSPCQNFSFSGKRKGMSTKSKGKFIFPSNEEYELYIKNEENAWLSINEYRDKKRKEFEISEKSNSAEVIEILTLEHYLELKGEGYEFEGQSYLFWEYMRILKEVKPKYFLLENVEMGAKWEKVLSKAIGVNGIHINSA